MKYGADSRQQVSIGGERVPNLYQRRKRDGSIAYEATMKFGSRIIRRTLPAKSAEAAAFECAAFVVDVRRTGRLPKIVAVRERQKYRVSVSLRALVSLIASIPRGKDDLYVIEDTINGCMKIGRSHNPQKRISDLQAANPRKLVTLAIIPGAGAWEATLHALLDSDHEQGEWFQSHDDSKALVYALSRKRVRSERAQP